MSGLQHVHVRVTDAATGKPTPCRVRFTDAAGKYYAPLGRLTEFATGLGADVGGNLSCPVFLADGRETAWQAFAYIDGGCEIALPPGPIRVSIAKGPEFIPLEQEVPLSAGKMALRFTLERWSDVRQQGWYPGDCRCHFLSPHAALLEGAAEDLAVVNLLACVGAVMDAFDDWAQPQARTVYSNLLSFSGQRPALEMPGLMVVVNTLNQHFQLGSLALLNCHRVVYPLRFGSNVADSGYENWTLADWCDQCHRKAGLVIWTSTSLVGAAKHNGEALANLITGKVDAMEVNSFVWERHQSDLVWYALLNAGLRVPLAGASAKNSNSITLGSVRTYARLAPGQPLTYTDWIEAVRAGRTFVTNAPMLNLTVNGQDPGSTVSIADGRPIQVRAAARSLVPFENLEIIVNGTAVASQVARGSPAEALLEKEITVPQGGWVAARCWGQALLPAAYFGQSVRAHTSPIYLAHADRPARVVASAVEVLLYELDTSLHWVNTEARFENDAQRQRLIGVFHAARRLLEQKLPPR